MAPRGTRNEIEAQYKEQVEKLEAENKELRELYMEADKARVIAERSNEGLLKIMDELKQKLAIAQEAIAKQKIEIEPDLVEIVAIPASAAVVPSPVKSFGGQRYHAKKDDNGFLHWLLPERYAKGVLASDGGLKHILVGPMNSLTIEKVINLRSKTEVIQRHVASKNRNGVVEWIPKIVEE